MIGIIGGSGFIGRALVDLLAAGQPVRIIDRAPATAAPAEVVRADVRDRRALTEATAGCTMLYNLAAEHRDDVRPRSRYDEVNVDGAANTVAAAEAHGIERIVFASSVAIYGDAEHELDESTPPRPFNDYGRTKLEAEGVFRAWATGAPGRSLTIVRPTVVFGPGNRGNVYELLAHVARGWGVVIGSGRNRKSMAYVKNVAGFLGHIREQGPGVQVYNYADKPDLDMNRLVEIVQAAFGRSRRVRHIPYALGLVAGHGCDLVAALTRRSLPVSAVRVRKYCANTRFTNRRALETGFVPSHSLEDALLETIRHEFPESRPAGRPVQARTTTP
jgi:GlcNAc-P-P-Und epimerase